MKAKVFAIACIFLSGAVLVNAAALENLGFDLAKVDSTTVIQQGGLMTDLLPGWELYRNAEIQNVVGFNANPISGGGFATVIDSARNPAFVEGPYATEFVTSSSETFSLVQDGSLPKNATTLTLRYMGGSFLLTINGVQVPDLNNSEFSGSLAFEAFDISNFAGENVELRLSSITEGLVLGEAHFLDSIRIIPEPGVREMFGLGALGLRLSLRKRFRTK